MRTSKREFYEEFALWQKEKAGFADLRATEVKEKDIKEDVREMALCRRKAYKRQLVEGK